MNDRMRNPVVLFLAALCLIGFGYFLGTKTDQGAVSKISACEAALVEAQAQVGAMWEHEWPDGLPERCPLDCGCLWNPDGSIGASSCLDLSSESVAP